MIAFLEGILVTKDPGVAVIDVGGVGYRAIIPGSTFEQLPAPGEKIKLFTRLVVKEEELQLYGFFTSEELSLFLKFLNVSGIGPRGAMALLSNFAPETLRRAVADENAALLAKAQGIGKKTAQRIILELKDSLSPVLPGSDEESSEKDIPGVKREAIEALTGLGYSKEEAKKAVARAVEQGNEDMEVQDLIKSSLKVLGNL